MENLFARAISENMLIPFALGDGEYFILDREWDEHWVLDSWVSHIIPYFYLEPSVCRHGLDSMFDAMIKRDTNDLYEKIMNLLYHVHVFYYQIKIGKLNGMNNFFECWEDQVIDLLDRYKNQSESIDNIKKMERSISIIKRNAGLLKYRYKYPK